MSDAWLFSLGCGVAFVFLAGAYVLVRASFSGSPPVR
jgi:hypothetical protein